MSRNVACIVALAGLSLLANAIHFREELWRWAHGGPLITPAATDPTTPKSCPRTPASPTVLSPASGAAC